MIKFSRCFKRIKDAFTYPFVSLSILLDESKRINENGYWDKHNRRKNEKEEKRRAKK